MEFFHKSSALFPYPLLISSLACVCLISSLEATNNGGFTIDLIHRDSPLSPYYNPSHTRLERLRNAYEHSRSRKSSLQSATTSPQSIQSTLTPTNVDYLIKIRIGTPPVELLGIADTGSDVPWVQCYPCSQCKENFPIFDPKKSRTYKKVSCESEQCSAVESSSCVKNNDCQYNVSYADSSYSTGDLSLDTFTFDSTSQDKASFPNVAFGCGHVNSNISGIIGLASGPLSIISQLSSSVGGKFSYCLTDADSNVSSKISFGSDAIVTGPNVVSTPLVNKSPDTLYYVTLEGFSAGTERSEYRSPAKQSVDPGNIIIDSGTTLTFVPPDLIDPLGLALDKVIKGKRVPDPNAFYYVCYEIPSEDQFDPPPITAHFTGADVVLPKENTFVEVEKGVACLNMVSSTDLSIIGNIHQINYKIGYDLVKQEVSFLPTDCTKFQ